MRHKRKKGKLVELCPNCEKGELISGIDPGYGKNSMTITKICNVCGYTHTENFIEIPEYQKATGESI